MGIIIRQGIKSTLFMYMGGVVGLLNRMYLMPKFLSLEQIGMLDLLFIAGLLFANIASLGTIGSLVKLYNKYQNQGKLKNFIGYLGKMVILGISLMFGLLYVFKPEVINYYSKDSQLVQEYFPFFYTFLVAFFLKGFLSNYSLTNQRATIPSVLFDFLFKAIQASLLLLIGFSFITFNGFIIILSLGYYALIFILFFYIKKNFGFNLSFNSAGINKKEVNQYGFFVWFAAMAGTITQFIDTAMVGSFEGLAMAGVYSIAFNLGQSVEMPRRAISSISLPIIVKHLDRKEYTAVNKIYKQSSINQGIVGALFLLLIFVCVDPIFYLLPQSKNLEIGKIIVLIIGTARFVDMITGVNSEILRSTERYKLDFYIIGSFILISVGLNYWLIPQFQLQGAAYASLIAIVGFNIIRIIILKRIYDFFPFTRQSIYLILVLGILITSRLLLPANPWLTQIGAIAYILLLASMYGGVFIFFVYQLKLSAEWNKLVLKLLSGITDFKK